MTQGFDQTLTAIETNLVAQVFGENLPLLGTHLIDAAAGGAPALHYVTGLKTALDSGLATLTGSATYTESEVEGALLAALSAAGITGGPNLDLSDASNIKLSLLTTKAFAAFDTPLDAKLGLPGINLKTSGMAHSTPNYALDFAVGLDGASGTDFYLNTAPGSTYFGITLDTKIPGFSADANLGPLKFMANDLAGPNATDFNAAFSVALKDPNNDGHLRTDELGGDLVDATLSGDAAVRLHLLSNLGTTVLPDIATDLNVDWSFNNSVVDPTAPAEAFGGVPIVAFKNVSVGLGSFFTQFVSPIFDKVQILTAPLQPIVDVLLERVGFLSDLTGSNVTLLDVAGGIGAVDAETAARLELYAHLIDFIDAIPHDPSEVRIDLGDYSLSGQDPRNPLFQLADAVPQSVRSAIAAGAQNGDLNGFLAGRDSLPGGGMSFPIIEDPTTAVNLLFGKPVDFFTYHVPGLDVNGLGFDEFFRIFGPFGVHFTATVEAHAFLDIGYDSTGVTQFASSGNPGDIFKGFYVVDQPGPEATLTAHLEAFAAANVVVAEVGVGGGIVGNLEASLNDTDSVPGDGRIHIGELSNSCVFDLSGEVVAGLSVYAKFGWGPVSETFEKTFGTDVLASFDATDCDAAGMPGVPVLGHGTAAGAVAALGPVQDGPAGWAGIGRGAERRNGCVVAAGRHARG